MTVDFAEETSRTRNEEILGEGANIFTDFSKPKVIIKILRENKKLMIDPPFYSSSG